MARRAKMSRRRRDGRRGARRNRAPLVRVAGGTRRGIPRSSAVPWRQKEAAVHEEIRALTERVQRESAFVDTLNAEIGEVIVGQQYMVERVLIGLLCDGHVL